MSKTQPISRPRSIFLTVALILALTASTALAAAISLNNAGFETGDLSNWDVYIPPGGYAYATTSGSGQTANEGSYFAWIKTNGPGSYTTVSQTLSANAGDTVSGAAFFSSGDYMPYNDDAMVRILTADGSEVVADLFYASTLCVGDYGSTPWTGWEHTFAESGTYKLEARAANALDGILDSYMGLDSGYAPPPSGAPVADAGGPYSGAPYSPILLSDATASDPDNDPLIIFWSYTGSNYCAFDNYNALNPSVTCYGEGSGTLKLVISDGLTCDVSNAQLSTVSNQPPALTVDNPSVSANEGALASNSGAVSDADGDTVALSASVGTVTNNNDGTWSWSFDSSDGPDESQTVTISADDGNGGTASISFDLVVDNVAPSIDGFSAPGDPVNIDDQPITAEVAFSDPGDDVHDVTFDWGDGSSDTLTGATSPASAQHTYDDPGVYEVLVHVEDEDGGFDEFVFQYVVIYDPDGGFVTGGGWIDSPAGAYLPDPELTGKANFGFVSKYKKGKNVPDGETEFQFQAGDLNFHSSTNEYLVINQDGKNAQFKGEGTINGSGSYKFMIWATDGDPDTFRIKIWDDNGGGVIYDNGAEQALGGGSIVVHKAKGKK